MKLSKDFLIQCSETKLQQLCRAGMHEACEFFYWDEIQLEHDKKLKEILPRTIGQVLKAFPEAITLIREKLIMEIYPALQADPHNRQLLETKAELEKYPLNNYDKSRRDRFEEKVAEAKEYPMESVMQRLGIEYKTRGNRLSARSPFARDSNPSFTVYIDSNTWFCFSTHQGGDTIKLVTLVLGLTFANAVSYILE